MAENYFFKQDQWVALTVFNVESAAVRKAVITNGLLLRNPDRQAASVCLDRGAKSCFIAVAARVIIFAAAATNCKCVSFESTLK